MNDPIQKDETDVIREPPPVAWWKRSLRILVALSIICAGIAGAAYLKKTAPRTPKRPPPKWVPVVRVETLRPTSHRVVVPVMGTVVPSRQIVLKPRVSGQVLAVHPEFVEGGFLKKGDEILRVDDADYRFILAQRESGLVDSRYALKLELGRQDVARREWELLNGRQERAEDDKELALRKPHLEKARADVDSARASLDKAKLDLARTRITAPFNAMVRTRSVDVGSQVSPQTQLAELVGTDVYWVKASIPVDRLSWIRIPQRVEESGSRVSIRYAQGYRIDGTVVRLMGDLATEGRMARILIEVRNPLGMGRTDNAPPLLIGEYVRIEIEGRQLENVFPIPRSALRENDRLWLLSRENTLVIKPVDVVWKDEDIAVVKNGLVDGDRIIVTDLPELVDGMEVRVGEDRAFPSPEKGGN